MKRQRKEQLCCLVMRAHLQLQRVHVIGTGGEVSVDQSSSTEGPGVGQTVVLKSHTVPLTETTVQTLSITA